MSRLMTVAKPALKSDSTETQPTAFGLTEDVITGDLLQERVNGHKSVRIEPRAIVTPSARDWLRRRDVEIVRGNVQKTNKKVTQLLAVVQTSTDSVVSALADAERSENWNQQTAASTAAAAQQAIDAVTNGMTTRVVVFSDEPEAAACLANRNESVRAASVVDAAAVVRARNNMDGNVFALDAAGRGFFELRNLLKRIEN